MTPPPLLRVEYDDLPNDVVDRVNRVLAAVGLVFVDDGKDRVGTIVYELRPVPQFDPHAGALAQQQHAADDDAGDGDGEA